MVNIFMHSLIIKTGYSRWLQRMALEGCSIALFLITFTEKGGSESYSYFSGSQYNSLQQGIVK